jgi:N-sulfoglucosamine sulfohydrolase
MHTHVGFADMDASPTKSWLVAHRDDPKWKWHFEHAFGRRPAEELYDLRKDPDQVRNLAAEPAYAATKRELADQLMRTLVDAGDPRVIGDGKTFDRPPFVGEDATPVRKDGKRKGR